MIIAERISVRQNNRVLFVAERISVRQIIVLYLWFCMYICLQRPSQGTPNPYVHYPVYFINEIISLLEYTFACQQQIASIICDL